MTPTHHLNPSPLSKEDLQTIAFAIAGILKDHYADVWLKREEAAAHVGYTVRKFDDLVRKKKFRAHRITPGADPRFLRSELNEDLLNA